MLIAYIALAAAVLAADRLVKLWIGANVALGETFASLGLFDLTYVRNTGAAFSMMSGKVSLLSAVSIIFCIAVIIYWIKKKPDNTLLRVSLSLMFSGALGNAIDRMTRGYVIDYIHTTFIDFPIFNIADIAITTGAAMMILYVILFSKDEEQ